MKFTVGETVYFHLGVDSPYKGEVTRINGDYITVKYYGKRYIECYPNELYRSIEEMGDKVFGNVSKSWEKLGLHLYWE